MSQQYAVTDLTSTGSQSGPFDGFARRHQDTFLLLGRLAMGAIFVTSGLHKLLALGGFEASLASKGVPLAAIFAPLGAAVEFFGGLAIVLGVATRASSLLMLAFVVVATAISHRFWEFDGAARTAQQINFDKNLCIAGSFVLLFAAGAGRFGIDGLFSARKGRP
jgi:putative oxidoreductase